MKIAFIGPGYLPIPPKDYGAIEILVWDLAEALRSSGISVDIYNSTNLDNVAKRIENNNYDFVHLQYDDHANYFLNRWRNSSIRWGCTNHFGWFNQHGNWPPHYHSFFDTFLHIPNMICLSHEIADYFEKNRKTNQKIFVLRNGVNLDSFRFSNQGNGKAICVGCVDVRKNQHTINQLCSNVDFVGPIRDDGRFEFINGNSYLGVWSKEKLYQELTNYSALILLSRGEAAPLVVLEAMAAGLSLIVSSESTANLDSKEFIHVVDIHNQEYLQTSLYKDVKRVIDDNKMHRLAIRDYAANKFDWKKVAIDYLDIIAKI